jgi:predicted RNA-binding protein
VMKTEFYYWECLINDMNFFIEKKNSIGFFHLKDNVNFKFILFNNNWLSCSNFFKLYKL